MDASQYLLIAQPPLLAVMQGGDYRAGFQFIHTFSSCAARTSFHRGCEILTVEAAKERGDEVPHLAGAELVEAPAGRSADEISPSRSR